MNRHQKLQQRKRELENEMANADGYDKMQVRKHLRSVTAQIDSEGEAGPELLQKRF